MSVNPIKYNKGNKNDILEYIKNYTMDFIYIDYKKSYDFINLKYPKIFKPVICSGCSQNLKIINNINEAIEYHKNIKDNYIIQDISYYKYEVGLLYERLPIQKIGNIVSINQRKFDDYNKLNIWNLNIDKNSLVDNGRNNHYSYINKNYLITKKLIN